MLSHFAQNVPIAPYTSYHIGGNAKYLIKVYDTDSLLRALEVCPKRLVLGRGSKVLVSDEGFDGAVILMRSSAVRFLKNGVYADAGVGLPVLSRLYAAKSLKGLEWACSIPASLGGAVKMNAGAYGGDMAALVNYVDVLRDGAVKRLSGSECNFGYRSSGFLSGDIILGACLTAEAGDGEEIKRLRAGYIVKRNEAQPRGFSCGSVFKGLELPAWKYIEDCGLKGMALNEAFVSEMHGNFIINKGFSKARDVYTLIRTIKAEVFVKTGVKLKEEVILAGEF